MKSRLEARTGLIIRKKKGFGMGPIEKQKSKKTRFQEF